MIPKRFIGTAASARQDDQRLALPAEPVGPQAPVDPPCIVAFTGRYKGQR